MAKYSKCYVTTPIYYASGNVQIGNTYSTVAADVFARFNRNMKRDTFYLTGMDEHGQKIEEAASKAGIDPKKYVDGIAEQTKELWKLMNMTNDGFIQTTDPHHEKIVQEIFEKMLEKGDIYLGSYEGEYCVSCESFYTKTQILEEGVCPDCGKPLRKVHEESYFLNLKKYAEPLLKHIETHPEFIQPESRKNEVVSFIKMGLEDLSVSRSSFKWGIPIKSNPKHVIYVWIDALSNYITALGYNPLGESDENYKKFWETNNHKCHIVGKDILRFHAVYWPIMLMSLGLPIDYTLYVHGWILTKEGKMSKSRGNAVYPHDLIDRYGVDPVRYYLAKELPLGNDGLFGYERFVDRYNNDLVNDLGNLLSRTVSMINKYNNGVICKTKASTEFDASVEELIKSSITENINSFENFKLQDGILAVNELISRANKYIDETAPWVLAKDESNKDLLNNVLYHLVEVLRVSLTLLNPVMPTSTVKAINAIGLDDISDLTTLKYGYNYTNKVAETVEPLFKRVKVEEELEYYNKLIESRMPKVEEVKQDPIIGIEDFSKCVIKVGEILESKAVEGSDKLLVSKVKIGEEVRQIVSGIHKFYEPSDIIGKHVLVVCNLAPIKLRGVESAGMILCVEKDNKLSLIEVPNMPSGACVK